MKLQTTTGKKVDVILKSPELHGKWVRLVHPLNNTHTRLDTGAFIQIRSYGGGLGKVALTHIDGARDTHLARHLSDEAKAALADIHCLLYGNDAGRAVVREKLDMALSAFMVPGIPPRPVRKA